MVHHSSVQLYHSSAHSAHSSAVLHHSSEQLNHSSVLRVLHHSSATVLNHSTVQLHHSSVPFCTSTVLHHSSVQLHNSSVQFCGYEPGWEIVVFNNLWNYQLFVNSEEIFECVENTKVCHNQCWLNKLKNSEASMIYL